MSTLLIRNISTSRITVNTKTGSPLRFAIGPNRSIEILQAQLSGWDQWSKQDLSEYVQKGFLRIDELNSVHIVPEKGRVLTATAFDLDSAVADSNEFKTTYSAHIADTIFHAVADATNTVAAADATDLSTMITLLTELQIDFTAHLTQASVHTNDDTVNGTALAAPTDLPTSLLVLEELYARFNQHRKQAFDDAAGPLTPLAIIAY